MTDILISRSNQQVITMNCDHCDVQTTVVVDRHAYSDFRYALGQHRANRYEEPLTAQGVDELAARYMPNASAEARIALGPDSERAHALHASSDVKES